MSKPWNRILWGIEFIGADKKPLLIGSLWHKEATASYPGEPTRALLFCSRAAARAWCLQENPRDCGVQAMRVVRVRETVRKV